MKKLVLKIKDIREMSSDQLKKMEFGLSECLGMGAVSSIKEAKRLNSELNKVIKVLNERGV